MTNEEKLRADIQHTINGEKVMTGQEWFDRFEKELDMIINWRTADEYQDKLRFVEQIKNAAKRAAGLEKESKE